MNGMESDTDQESAPTWVQRYGLSLALGGMSLFCIITAIILLVKTSQISEPIRFSSDQAVSSVSSQLITVDIEGAVLKPGVYELSEGSRVIDLLEQAGGFSDEADEEWVAKTLNQADFLSDGAKFFIPKKGMPSDTSKTGVVSGSSIRGVFISINTASEKELDSLPGVGAVTVQKIISGRPYQRLEELLEKNIVGQSVYEKIRPKITL